LAGEFAGKVLVAKVDVDANPGLAQAFNVQSIPYLLFVKGRKLVRQFVGVQPEMTLRQAIQRMIAA
jgi:thioredoxin-like negative regulator of GroEL